MIFIAGRLIGPTPWPQWADIYIDASPCVRISTVELTTKKHTRSLKDQASSAEWGERKGSAFAANSTPICEAAVQHKKKENRSKVIYTSKE